VVEGTPPTGYGAADDQNINLTGNQTVNLTFTDPRLHKVIVLVCHEGSNTLYSSTDNVTFDGDTKTSISSVPSALSAKGVTQADLCGIGGASFGGKAHGSYDATVDIASH
jgi:hypothetical protein